MKFPKSRLAVAAATAVMAAGSLVAMPGTAGAAGTLKSGPDHLFHP